MTDPITRAALACLAAVLVLLAAVGGGYWWGDNARDNAWLAKQALAERQAQKAYADEVERGQQKSAELLGQIAATQTNYDQLQEKFDELRARGPLLVLRAPAAGATALPGNKTAAAAASANAADAALATAPQPASAANADAVAELAADAGGGAYLTAGTVWLWNSALAGRDTPQGACGAGDTASSACAVDSGISFSQALANHTQNAKSCALDRLRHQALIEFITERQNPTEQNAAP
ncbi:MAG: hypothetical protein ACKVOO_12575 [Burkholderiaceae bacterium]